jgi:hypothetical protein
MLLSNENLREISDEIPNPFEVERKIQFNNLQNVESRIKDFGIYHAILKSIYDRFDEQGKNRSLTVINKVKSVFCSASRNESLTQSDIFYETIDELITFVKNCKVRETLSEEELLFAIYIIVVDSFIRCNIFKDPEGYVYATTL